jgi:hypothetical protein
LIDRHTGYIQMRKYRNLLAKYEQAIEARNVALKEQKLNAALKDIHIRKLEGEVDKVLGIVKPREKE